MAGMWNITDIVVSSHVIAQASPALSGLGIEDANHQLYGGLYAQMVFGESFEEPAGPDGASGSAPWTVFAQQGYFGTSQGPTWQTVQGSPSVSSVGAFSGEQSQRLPPGASVENSGLLGAGMFFERGRKYQGALYARATTRAKARLTIAAIVGGMVAAEFVADQTWSLDWQRVPFSLVPNVSSVCPLSMASSNHSETCNTAHRLTGCTDGCVSSPELGKRCIECDGRLRLSVDGSAVMEVDQVSLLPAEWGLFQGLPVRRDLGELMAASNKDGIRVSALRLGGSMVLCDGYRWKNFRGPREHRQPYRGVWYRYDTAGWKIFEFLDLCEATGMHSCIVTLNVNERVADLEDLVEYAFGNSSSKWGTLRMNDGRVKPYRPFLVEIGNENTLNFTGKEPIPCRETCANFSSRWAERAHAMDAKARSLGLNLTFIVGFDAQHQQSCTRETVRAVEDSILAFADLVADLGPRAVWDCHTGGDSPSDGNVTAAALEELQRILHRKQSPMRAAVLEENGDTHNMFRMLGHVTQNHAFSRLGNFVVVNTVATGLQPLGRNSNGWDQGNIFFTPNASWLSPPAVGIRMISAASQGMPEVLAVTHQPSGLDVLASQSSSRNRFGVRVANPYNTSVHTSLSVDGWSGLVHVEVLAADSPQAVYVEPVRARTTWFKLRASGWTFPPYSFTTFVSTESADAFWV